MSELELAKDISEELGIDSPDEETEAIDHLVKMQAALLERLKKVEEEQSSDLEGTNDE